MKIHGPNQTNFNPYKKQIQKQQENQNTNSLKDKVEISNKAKQMQEMNKAQAARKEHIEEIKNKVDAGEYQVDANKTAEKMIDFWTNR
ncbi:flagellar biosynthesis anti-sigma factor FlgM [Pontibacillus sp. HMF3514]|uniref:flagellar biosynthesis anti-sigma factor FlgM n=1 Tax=Pontibacillus sp. HMF3514 TaxID=2692425 RepID=UPI00131F5C00|nr:flagellar biosynthesis anti-sigma factor FlgM [Pontibacillus sp. HMF3514]QHE53600.1 flagellar biosynthesis anti-sigma factor FlgM [Pontibacillus sp. HMF3514]